MIINLFKATKLCSVPIIGHLEKALAMQPTRSQGLYFFRPTDNLEAREKLQKIAHKIGEVVNPLDKIFIFASRLVCFFPLYFFEINEEGLYHFSCCDSHASFTGVT